MIRIPVPPPPLPPPPATGTREGHCHGELGRRRLLHFLFASTVALPAATDSQKALLQKYLEKTKENKAKNDKERQDSYYRRNYKDYFDFVDGANRGKSDELLSDSDRDIRRWLQNHR